MKNQIFSNILNHIVNIMIYNNCRVYDSDIIIALKHTTYDIENNEIKNIFVDIDKLIKHY